MIENISPAGLSGSIQYKVLLVNIDELLTSPDYLLSAVDQDKLTFAYVKQSTYTESAFLDHRIKPMPNQAYSADRALLASACKQRSATSNPDLIIAHSSFCASTLLARCLDAEDVLVLREPQVLGALANIRRQKRANGDYLNLLKLVTALFGKRYHADQKLVLKPSNYANNLVADMMALAPDCQLLLMIGSLDDFMVSMHIHAREAATTLPVFLRALLMDLPVNTRQAFVVSKLTVLQQSALLWSLQMELFIQLSITYVDRVRILPTHQFFARGGEVLQAIDSWIGGTRSDADRVDALTRFKQADAKSRGGSGSTARALSRESVKSSIQSELDAARQWALEQQLVTDLSGFDQSLMFRL